MCEITKKYYTAGEAKGRAEGHAEGRAEGIVKGQIMNCVANIRALMDTLGKSFDEVVCLLKLSDEDIAACRPHFEQ